jgi:hypothetical protein
MYVESLTGTHFGAEGIPLPPVLSLRLRLASDAVPEWLYDTVGKLDPKPQAPSPKPQAPTGLE